MMKYLVILLFPLALLAQSIEDMTRKDLVVILESQLYVRELTGNNDGTEVEEYLLSVGLGKGYPWCAAYTTWGLDQCLIPNPQSAWSPNWAKNKDVIWSQSLVKQRKMRIPKSGDTFTLFYNSLNRVGHVGFILEEKEDYFITIEGNTNIAGSRAGIGVFKRKRDKRKIYRITNYITPYYNN